MPMPLLAKYLCCPRVHQPDHLHSVQRKNTGCPYLLFNRGKAQGKKTHRNPDNWSKGKLVKEHEISLSGAACQKNVDGCSLVVVPRHYCSLTQRARCCSCPALGVAIKNLSGRRKKSICTYKRNSAQGER